MKKIFISVGLAASAAGMSSVHAQEMQAASPKLWNVSATLRGFYDDNYTYGNSNGRQGSWGWEFSPSVSGNIDLQQTDFGARYTFGMYYYVQREEDGVDPIDYTHKADLWLDHAFDQTLKVNLTDSFVLAQDPKLVNGGTVNRVSGDNINNYARVTLSKEWTRHFGTATYYGNRLVKYSDETSGGPNVNGSNPSNDALLSRIEQSVGNDFRWEFQPQTVGFIGYNFTWVRYTGDQQIAPPAGGISYFSDSRDYDAHYMYLGAEHVFSPNFSAMGKAGATYVDLYNDPVSSSESWAPYGDISATYTYIPGCYLQGGFRQEIRSTSEVTPGSDGQLTQYQETSTVYLDWTHRFGPKITSTVVGQYMYSSFKDGAFSGQPENDVTAGVNLNYQFNRHFWADAGYNFSELFSSANGRANTRNVVYLGVGASY